MVMPGSRTKLTNRSAHPDSLLDTYDKIIASVEGVERKGATLPYTSHNGHMFSFISADGLMSLKLPAESLQAFIKKYNTRNTESHGIVQKEFVIVPAELFGNVTVMKKYFRESYEYVNGLKPKATKKAAAKK